MWNNSNSLMCYCNMLNMCEMFGTRLLDTSQKQETITIWSKYWMMLDIQPLVFWRSFVMVLKKGKKIFFKSFIYYTITVKALENPYKVFIIMGHIWAYFKLFMNIISYFLHWEIVFFFLKNGSFSQNIGFFQIIWDKFSYVKFNMIVNNMTSTDQTKRLFRSKWFSRLCLFCGIHFIDYWFWHLKIWLK